MAPTILVADDEPHILQVLTVKLRGAGYDVFTAGDGEEALELARTLRPALVITDFQMPFMNGLELCRALAAEPRTEQIPVLMLTARSYAFEKADLAGSNIRGVMTKPFSPRALLDQVVALTASASWGDDSEPRREAA